jgi:hypothetical protein
LTSVEISAPETRKWLSDLVEKACLRVNATTAKTLMARRPSEKPPLDERHLTDTRTRVSSLLETALALALNEVLIEQGNGIWLSSVLWNVFPDLIVRDKKGERYLGLEVKALHTAAEEKSANFYTPISVIRKDQDFVLVLVWGWHRGETNGVEIVFPTIHFVAIANAWLLAKMRDYSWLFATGGRRKAIDLISAVIDGDSNQFKQEERNMGKLMRIDIAPELPSSVPFYEEMRSEAEHYRSFKTKTLVFGIRETFKDICLLLNSSECQFATFDRYPESAMELGSATLPGERRLVLVGGRAAERWLSSAPQRYKDGTAVLYLSQKLDWEIFEVNDGRIISKGTGQKPESQLQAIIDLL